MQKLNQLKPTNQLTNQPTKEINNQFFQFQEKRVSVVHSTTAQISSRDLMHHKVNKNERQKTKLYSNQFRY